MRCPFRIIFNQKVEVLDPRSEINITHRLWGGVAWNHKDA